MLTRNERKSDAKISLRHLLIQKYGSAKLELINQVLDSKADLEFTDKSIKELEKMIDKKNLEKNSMKSKLLVKPHIAKKLLSLKKVPDLLNTSINKSTQIETDRPNLINQFNTESKELQGDNGRKVLASKTDIKKRFISDKFDSSQRKRHTVLGLPSISFKELDKNLDNLKLVKQSPKTSLHKISNNTNLAIEQQGPCTINITCQPTLSNNIKDLSDKATPNQQSRSKPKSLLKNSFCMKSPHPNNTFFNSAVGNQLDHMNSFNIKDEVLKDIDESITDEKAVKRGKSTGNFITGRDNHSLKRLIAQTSNEASDKEISEIDMNLELDEIREIVSGEGSFISQDMFKPKKPDKKEPKTAYNRKSQNINIKVIRSTKQITQLVNETPNKKIITCRNPLNSKEIQVPIKTSINGHPSLAKKNGNRIKESRVEVNTPLRNRQISNPELGLRTLKSPPIKDRKINRYSFVINK